MLANSITRNPCKGPIVEVWSEAGQRVCTRAGVNNGCMKHKLPAALWPGMFWLGVVLTGWFALAPATGGGEPAFGWDKADHLIAFACMAVCAQRAWPRAAWWRVFLPLVGYGVLIEVAQAFVPGREPSAVDVLADAFGAALALVALPWLMRGLGGREA